MIIDISELPSSNNVASTTGNTGVSNNQFPYGSYQGQHPNVCPGCGRCNCCGRPYYEQPYNPFTYPYPITSQPQVTWQAHLSSAEGISSGVVAINNETGEIVT